MEPHVQMLHVRTDAGSKQAQAQVWEVPWQAWETVANALAAGADQLSLSAAQKALNQARRPSALLIHAHLKRLTALAELLSHRGLLWLVSNLANIICICLL